MHNFYLTYLFRITLLFTGAFPLISQTVKNTAFQGGERLKYTGSYNMSSLWTDIAEVTLEVIETKAASKPILNLRMTASTYISWDNYFKVRDLYQSWVDPVSTLPLVFKRDMYEGGYTKDSKYIFKRNSLAALAIEKKKTEQA